MKKILLSIGLFFSLVMVGKSQTVLNELYTDPGSQSLRGEFIELYNTSINPAGQNVNCFTIVTYYDNGGSDRGWYVMDLPNLTVGAKSFFVAAAGNPFTTQNNPLPGVVPNFSWNDPNFRSGSTGGSLTKWQINGTGYTNVSGTIPANFNDFLSGGQGQDYVVLVFVDGQFSNGFIGGSNSPFLSGSTATPLPGILPVTMNGCANFNINFSTLTAMETVGSQPGSDNGYARTSDGKCGAWQKTSASLKHTPGVTNGSAAGITGALTTTEILKCNIPGITNPRISRVIFDVTGITGDATLAADFPVEVQLYYDFTTAANRNPNGVLDGADSTSPVLKKIITNVVSPADSFDIKQTASVILVYKTARGCFDKVVLVANGCIPLPVNFKSFTAARNHSVVGLKWETASEQNNSGFSVQRNTRGTWEQVAFVPSQAAGGNSDAILTYTLSDLNNERGISQYRIKQIDIDAKATFSEIRAVRGEGQVGKTTVYPNPSSNGRVNVVFEDGSVSREVSVMDMSGRMVKQYRAVTNNNITIDNLTPGMYSIRIFVPATGEQVVEKIVVNKR